ncbi:MAG: NAD(P)/FAD-dependent oxidoreductase [Bacteroidia bacterium]|nr:NAD(P)/FAD-dependent oxidoreductase [Bacteroidia bacterium]
MDLENGIKDIVIVGAGPAGVACAWRLAQLGYEPVLLEKETFPRDKVCGDALSGKVVALLRKLGGDAILTDLLQQPFAHPVEYLDFFSGKGVRVRLRFPPRLGYPQGFLAPRYWFDQWLVRHLPTSVRLITGFTVQRLQREADVWIVHGSEGRSIKARFVVGADGTTSRVAPIVHAYHRIPRPIVYPSVRGYIKGEPIEGLQLHFKKPYLPGYLWKFPLSDKRLNVGMALPTDSLRRANLSLRKHAAEVFPEATALGGHGIPVALQSRPLAAPGCALVGDAAALADPLTGEGIGNALLSGIRLAEALARVPITEWAISDWNALYARPLYQELSQQFRLMRFLHKLARSAWRLEMTIAAFSLLPIATKPLLRWYGAKD